MTFCTSSKEILFHSEFKAMFKVWIFFKDFKNALFSSNRPHEIIHRVEVRQTRWSFLMKEDFWKLIWRHSYFFLTLWSSAESCWKYLVFLFEMLFWSMKYKLQNFFLAGVLIHFHPFFSMRRRGFLLIEEMPGQTITDSEFRQ